MKNGSWVSPQLAFDIALPDDGLAECKLKKIIENASAASNPKTLMSAYSSLKFLESKIAEDFENIKIFPVLKEKDA